MAVEINLPIKTMQIGGIYIEDMVKKFGWRIRKAVFYEDGKPKGLISVEMVKLMRWWKFWNRDIKRAYKRYTGILTVPWTIKLVNPPIIEDHHGIDWDKMDDDWLQGYSKDVLEKYKDKPVNPDFYSTIKITEKDE